MLSKEVFNQSSRFLFNYVDIFQKEALNTYPLTLDDYPEEWIKYLASQLNEKRIDTLNNFYNGQVELDAPKGLQDFCKTILNIQEMIPHHSCINKTNIDFKRKLFTKIKDKKKHELTVLSSLVKELSLKNSFTTGIDIGGGVGHTSRFLSSTSNLKMLCIDQDKQLQVTGSSIIKKYNPELEDKISFINSKIETSLEKKNKISTYNIDNQSLLIGLHTCGGLANSVINLGINNNAKTIISFGCCYSKSDPDSDVNVSEYVKSSVNRINISVHALNLATRAHHSIATEDFTKTLNVKRHRYALHLLLFYKVGIKNFISIGDSKHKDYSSSFCLYAKSKIESILSDASLQKLHDLNIKPLEKLINKDVKEIEDFYLSDLCQKEVNRLIAADLIRWRLGRILEYYILTDRAILLQENGRKVELFQVFDEKISPRNIGIISTKE